VKNKWIRGAGRAAVVVLALSRCASQETDSGSQTHWMDTCSRDGDCGAGLSCACGVCTKPCAAASACDGLGRGALCAAPGGAAHGALCAAAAPAVCVPACGAGCGASEHCVDGACVPGPGRVDAGRDSSEAGKPPERVDSGSPLVCPHWPGPDGTPPQDPKQYDASTFGCHESRVLAPVGWAQSSAYPASCPGANDTCEYEPNALPCGACTNEGSGCSISVYAPCDCGKGPFLDQYWDVWVCKCTGGNWDCRITDASGASCFGCFDGGSGGASTGGSSGSGGGPSTGGTSGSGGTSGAGGTTASGGSAGNAGGLGAECTATGGTVDSGLCCASASDFPDDCAIGACSCSPSNSHTVQRCTCPTGQCFKPGNGCVAR
jgi:hypothetical protein